jgi:RNA polymerase-binding transcription factor DksA
MRAQSSRPTPVSRGGLSGLSQGIRAGPADTPREEVARQLDQALKVARTPSPSDRAPGSRPSELADAAQQEVLLSQDAIAATRAHARAHAAMEAARRIADGSYGICQACGERIPPLRLLAVPLTRCCLPCQDIRERQQRNRYRVDEGDG